MKDHELRNSEPPKIWDNTMLVMLDQCPRKLYYFLRQFDYDKQSTPAYFVFGRAFHEGLLTWYSDKPTTSGTEAHLIRQVKAINAALCLWDDEGVQNSKLDTRDNLKNKLTLYFEEYPSEEWTFVPQGGEVGWIWPLDSRWELGGAMDGYVNWPGRGLMNIEHKTTGNYLYPGYIEQFQFSRQITQYFWYLSKLLPREELYGALVNMITKNIKTPRSKWKYPEFDRIMIKKAPWQLEEFEEDVLKELKVFEKYWNDWYWPRKGMKDPANCVGGPGKSPCLFRGICRTPLRIQDVNVDAFEGITLRKEPWEPWKRKEES